MKRRFFTWPCCGVLWISLLTLGVGEGSGAVVLQDDFNNGIITTPDPPSALSWSLDSATNASEVGGILTVGTNSSAVSNSNNLRINTTAALNPFTSNVQISVREFALFGTGSYEAADRGRFRIGLVSENGSFFGADDGFAFEINKNGLGARLGTKLNAPSGDPNGAALSITDLTEPITGFDLMVNSTSWALTLYFETGDPRSESGSWSLGTPEMWGAGTSNVGNSALLLAVQNNMATEPLSGFKSFSIGSIEVTATAIPEPSRMALLMTAVGAAFLTRGRSRPASRRPAGAGSRLE